MFALGIVSAILLSLIVLGIVIYWFKEFIGDPDIGIACIVLIIGLFIFATPLVYVILTLCGSVNYELVN